MGGGFNTLTALMRCSSISALLRPSPRRHAVIGDEARCDLFGSEGTVDLRLIRDVGLVTKVLYVSPALRVRGGQVVLFYTISIENVAREDPLARSPAATPAVKGRS